MITSCCSRASLVVLAALVVAGCELPLSTNQNRDTKGKPSQPSVDTSPKIVPRGELPIEEASAVMRRACRKYASGASDPVRCLARLPEAGQRIVLQGGRDYEQLPGAFLFAVRMGDSPPGQVTLTLFGGRRGGLPLTQSEGQWPAEADQEDVGDALNIIGYAPLDPNDPDARLGPNARPKAVGRTSVDGRPAILVAWRDQPFSGTVHAANDGIIFNRGDTGWLVSLRFTKDVDRAARTSMLRRIAESLETLDSQGGAGTS